MDYDGANQHAVTHLGEDSISPRVSPDNSLVAFASRARTASRFACSRSSSPPRSLQQRRAEPTSRPPGLPAGKELAFSSSRTGDPEIWISDPQGSIAHRVTSYKGPDVFAHLHPKTGAQIAWISGRTGLPQLYIMTPDGFRVTRMTDGGYATSASWSPNGPVHRLCLGSQIRPRRSRRPGHLAHGSRHQALDSAYPRNRPLRLPHLVSRRPPHRLRELTRRRRQP